MPLLRRYLQECIGRITLLPPGVLGFASLLAASKSCVCFIICCSLHTHKSFSVKYVSNCPHSERVCTAKYASTPYAHRTHVCRAKYASLYAQYVQMCIICTTSADIVKKHVVLDTGLYNLGQADMRWRLYGVEVTVSTLLPPCSS